MKDISGKEYLGRYPRNKKINKLNIVLYTVYSFKYFNLQTIGLIFRIESKKVEHKTIDKIKPAFIMIIRVHNPKKFEKYKIIHSKSLKKHKKVSKKEKGE